MLQNSAKAIIQANDPNVVKASTLEKMRDVFGDVLADFRCANREIFFGDPARESGRLFQARVVLFVAGLAVLVPFRLFHSQCGTSESLCTLVILFNTFDETLVLVSGDIAAITVRSRTPIFL